MYNPIIRKKSNRILAVVSAVIIASFGFCRQEKLKYKDIEVDGEIFKGTVVDDSILHGRVKIYDKESGQYKGHTEYSFGQEIGPKVRVWNSQRIDSFVIEKNLKSGNEFIVESENVKYSAHVYDGRIVGPVHEYDNYGKVTDLHFFNFEGELIYSASYKDSGYVETGSVFNISINDKIMDGKSVRYLFLYNILQPSGLSYYSLGLMNRNKEIRNTKRLKPNKFYIEIELEKIPDSLHYALVYHYSAETIEHYTLIKELFLDF